MQASNSARGDVQPGVTQEQEGNDVCGGGMTLLRLKGEHDPVEIAAAAAAVQPLPQQHGVGDSKGPPRLDGACSPRKQ